MLTKYEIEEKDLEKDDCKIPKIASGGIVKTDINGISISSRIMEEPIRYEISQTATEIRYETYDGGWILPF